MNRVLVILTLHTLATGLPGLAQSAVNFDRDHIPASSAGTSAEDTPQPGTNRPAPVPTPEETSESIKQPSRMALLNRETYIAAILPNLSMESREWDPFARNKSPDYVRPRPKPAQPTTRAPGPRTPAIPFSRIIASIPVTTVAPSQGTFLVGGRSFRIGDRIELNPGAGDLLPVTVVSVRSSGIRFRNEISKEEAELPLNLMPEGMSRGSQAIPPGVVAADASTPLSINPPRSPSSNN